MGFKFGKGDRVETANGKSGEVNFSESKEARNSTQDRYTVKEDEYWGGRETMYFEGELRHES